MVATHRHCGAGGGTWCSTCLLLGSGSNSAKLAERTLLLRCLRSDLEVASPRAGCLMGNAARPVRNVHRAHPDLVASLGDVGDAFRGLSRAAYWRAQPRCLSGVRGAAWVNITSVGRPDMLWPPVRGCSAVGSAPPWHGGGQGFESPQLHVRESPESSAEFRFRDFFVDEDRSTIVSVPVCGFARSR